MAVDFPIGTYYAQIQGGEMMENDNGKPFFALSILVTHESQDGQWVSVGNPAERIVELYTSDAAWTYTQRKLASIQFNGDFSNPQFGVAGVSVDCKHQESTNGGTYERWDLSGFGGGARGKAATRQVIQTMNAKWKQSVGSQAAPAAPPPPPAASVPAAAPAPAPAGAPANNEDDLPF